MRHAVVLSLCLLLMPGCAGMSATQAGQTAGTIAGASLAPGIGAPVGALVGLLAGLIVQQHIDQVVEKRERKELQRQLVTGSREEEPAASPPGEATRVWIDERWENGRVSSAILTSALSLRCRAPS